MDTLLTLDRALFLAINHLPHAPLSDWLALFFSGVGNLGAIWLVFGAIIFLREERKDHHFLFSVLFALGLCSLLVEVVLKSVFVRMRPGADIGAIVVGGGASWYSFPSSHAAISWAMAVVLSSYEPRFRWVWFTLASIISLTRVYLGVHYPLDVVVGALIGAGIGVGVRTLLPRPNGTRRKKQNCWF